MVIRDYLLDMGTGVQKSSGKGEVGRRRSLGSTEGMDRCGKKVAAGVLFQRQRRTGGWVWRGQGSSKDQQLAFLFPWSVQLVRSQGTPTAAEGQDNALS